ncbi:MAG: guanylate kinase [Cyanobacteriota bacterium]|nr:guanylate kinase [Cyanobacteriota bacterium]
MVNPLTASMPPDCPSTLEPELSELFPTDPPAPSQAGRLLVVTGPSGVGKGTLVKQLRRHHPDLHFSVSVTTRPPRPGEAEGVNYFFRSREEFLQLQEAGGLLEWAEYAGNFYGTPLATVQQQLQQGQDVLLEIELEGSRQIAQRCPEAIRIFISPPSLAELERRLRERAQDSEASIQKRLAQAEAELAASGEFDYLIVNDNVETALAELESILYYEKMSYDKLRIPVERQSC